MKSRIFIQKKVVQFSHWSRKAYAVFASLHKVVNIMCLRIDTCISSLSKNKTVVSILFFAKNSEGINISNADEDLLEEEVLIMENFSPTFAFQTVKNIELNNIIPSINFPKSIFYRCRIWTLFLYKK